MYRLIIAVAGLMLVIFGPHAVLEILELNPVNTPVAFHRTLIVGYTFITVLGLGIFLGGLKSWLSWDSRKQTGRT